MLRPGLKLRPTDHRDYDFHKTLGSVAFNTASLPSQYDADAGLTMPDQQADGYSYGCTGYTQADLCADQDRVVYDAGELYLATPPGNRTQGRELRKSMAVLINRGPKQKDGSLGEKRTAYFNIRSTGFLDWFDAIKVALWITQDEKRTASIAVPWFPEYALPKSGILDIPVDFHWRSAIPHNAKISGWTDRDTKGNLLRGGEEFLKVKSWQGPNYGDHGWCYMSRQLANAVFEMDYTEAMTVTKVRQGDIQRIDLTIIELLVSFIHNLIAKYAPEPPKPLPEPPKPPTPIEDRYELLEAFCAAIKQREGWFPGSRSYRNKNPGNLRRGQFALAIGFDEDGFAIFKTEHDGLITLKNVILNAAKGASSVYKPTDNLRRFFAKYAPDHDSNDSKSYADFVAARMGVDPLTWKLRELVS